MNEISVFEVGGELRADSRTFAEKLDVRHRQIMVLVRKYQAMFEDHGRVVFQTHTFETAGGPQEKTYALLNEDQSYFLLTLSRNNDITIRAKSALVKAFRQARSHIAKAETARLEGKKARSEETSAIADLVRYATDQGSESAKMYYVNITKMTNRILGLESGKRDSLPANTLDSLRLAETMIDVTIRDGLRAGLHYKQIYALAKDRLSMMVPLLPKS
jgi:phage regulator Rha-like protein